MADHANARRRGVLESPTRTQNTWALPGSADKDVKAMGTKKNDDLRSGGASSRSSRERERERDDPPTDPLLAHAVFMGGLFVNMYLATIYRTGPMLFAAFMQAVFLAMNLGLRVLLPTFWPAFEDLTPWKKSQVINLSISGCHSLLCSILCVIGVVVLYDEFVEEPNWLLPSKSVLPTLVVGVSAGYTWADTWDMLNNGMARKFMYLMVHHAALVSCLTIGLYLDLGLRYLIICLLCEINSIFLHMRSVMQIAGFTRESHMFRTVWRLVFLSLYTTRLPTHAFLASRVFLDRELWPSFSIWLVGFGSLCAFVYLNINLNRDLGKAYRRTRQNDSSKRVRTVSFFADYGWPVLNLVGAVSYVLYIKLSS